jgi:hypothetical protein
VSRFISASLLATLCVLFAVMAACRSAQQRTPSHDVDAMPASGENPQWTEAFPGVRMNLAERWIEIQGEVAINAHDPDTPIVYIEAFVCIPDSKEHESLVLTRVKPSHVHAALLAMGLTPGTPGAWSSPTLPIDPTGDGIDVRFITTGADGEHIESLPPAWLKHMTTAERLTPRPGKPEFVFAGSRWLERAGQPIYDADLAGVLVGLHAFGGETIAWSTMLSPWASVAEPVWIADAAIVPKPGTPVTVLIGPAIASDLAR